MAMKLRSIALSLLATSGLIMSTTLPGWAVTAYLTARQSGSAINLRSRPSTEAYSPGTGLAGDIVEARFQEVGDDGFVWYYVELRDRNLAGWVRSDFVALQPGSSPLPGQGTGGSVRPDTISDREYFYSQGYQQGQADAAAGIQRDPSAQLQFLGTELRTAFRLGYETGYNYVLAGNSPSTSLPSSSQGTGGSRPINTEYYYNRGFEQGQTDALAGRSQNPNVQIQSLRTEETNAYRQGYSQGYAIIAAGNNQFEVGNNDLPFAFQTEDYSVRVFRVGNDIRMNVFNATRDQLELNAVSVRAIPINGGIYYVYQGNNNVEVFSPDRGDRVLRITSLDSILEQEQLSGG